MRALTSGGCSAKLPVVETARESGHDAATRIRGFLTVGISQNAEQAQLRHVTMTGITMGLLIFVLCLPLASGLIHRIFLPIRQLVAASKRIASGDFTVQVATDRPDEIGKAFEREVLAVQWNQHGVGGNERIQREESKRRRTVDQNQIEMRAQRLEQTPQPMLARGHRHTGDFRWPEPQRRMREHVVLNLSAELQLALDPLNTVHCGSCSRCRGFPCA